jgi:hypothetical protein
VWGGGLICNVLNLLSDNNANMNFGIATLWIIELVSH